MDLIKVAKDLDIAEEDLIQLTLKTLDEIVGANTGKILMNYIRANDVEGLINGLKKIFGPGFEVISKRIVEKMEPKPSLVRLELLSGNLRLEDRFFILISAATVKEIFRSLEMADKDVLKAVGKEIGASLVSDKEFYTLDGEDDSFIEELVQEQLFALSRFGWGRFKLDRMDREKNQILIQAYNSVFVQEQKVEKPLCAMMEMILEGVFLRLFDDPHVRCVEVACSVQGFPCCTFKVNYNLC